MPRYVILRTSEDTGQLVSDQDRLDCGAGLCEEMNSQVLEREPKKRKRKKDDWSQVCQWQLTMKSNQSSDSSTNRVPWNVTSDGIFILSLRSLRPGNDLGHDGKPTVLCDVNHSQNFRKLHYCPEKLLEISSWISNLFLTCQELSLKPQYNLLWYLQDWKKHPSR